MVRVKKVSLYERGQLTTKQLAEQLKVSVDVITNCVRRVMPDKLKKGKTTLFNEIEASTIIKELKSNVKVFEQLTSEAGSEVKNTSTNILEIQEAQEKTIEGVKAIKKLDIRDQYKISMEIQKSILEQLGEQNNKLFEQNNTILQLNAKLAEQNKILQNREQERLDLYNKRYREKELRTKINRRIREIAKEHFNGNFKECWNFYYKKYADIHCFTTKQTLNLIAERGALKEFYDMLLNV